MRGDLDVYGRFQGASGSSLDAGTSLHGHRKPVAGMPMTLPMHAKNFTIFEGTSEIQRMIIGRAVTGLDVR